MDAYIAALHLLARRELSEVQVRQRLARREHLPDAIDEAVARLTRDGTLNDRRVAAAAARLEGNIRGRGPARVRQRLRSIGIDDDLAATAVRAVFDEVDEATLVDKAIARRLKGQAVADLDQRARARIVRSVAGQGFSIGAVLARLRQMRS